MAPRLLILLAALSLAQGSFAQSGVSFEWVTVGDPGNPNDPLTGISTGGQTPPTRGAVPYVYSISKYETTIGQYTAFLNAVAKSDPQRARSLYPSDLGDLDTIRGIARVALDGKDVYYVKNVSQVSGGRTSANLPITFVGYSVNFLSNAVRFLNWLHNGQGNGSTETGAYTISEGGQITRSPDARYWIPTENEWYKAAYYDPSPEGPADDYWLFPWRGDSDDGGRQGNYYFIRYYVTNRMFIDPSYTYLTDVRAFSSAHSYYGTLNQAGNVEEWTEGDVFSGGPHTRGGWWGTSGSNPPQNYSYQRMASLRLPGQDALGPISSGGIGLRVASVANPPAGGLRNGDKIRFYPRAGYNSRMVGGVFEADSGGSFAPYTVLHTITETPPDGWTEVSVDFGDARNFRYRSPDSGYGNVAEIEFYRSGAKVIAAASGTPGSWSGKDNDTFRAALDGDTSTFFDAPQPNGAYVDLDTGQGTPFGTPYRHDHLTVTGTNANGSGDYPLGERVRVYVILVPDGQYFAGWEGFTSILDDPTSRDTYATIPGIGVDLRLNATFKALPPGSHVLEVASGSGDGVYPTGTMVTVSADPPQAGQEFTGWTGDIAILSNPFLATTTAITLSRNVNIAATYGPVGSGDKIRYYPRQGWTERMVGVVFEGTNGDPVSGPYETIYTVTSNPSVAWSEVPADLKDYRYLRYRGPNGSFGNVAEIEFYRDGVKLAGTGFGTPGSWNNQGNTLDKAFDGDVNTFFDAPNADGNYAGIDTRAIPSPETHILQVLGGSGSGVYPTGTMVTVSANQVPEGWVFMGWTGDITILSNPSLATTTATIPSRNVRIAISYRDPSDRIRLSPRVGFEDRMVGGVFEGTNGDPVNGPYETIYTVTQAPPALGSSAVSVDLKDYRYLRYRGPDNSYGNVAEIEFFRDEEWLTGVAFGTPGSWNNQGNTLDKALDGNLNTFFDAPVASGAYVGIDTRPISGDAIRFYPRLFHTDRMVGGVFEGTSGDPVNGPYETIYTITSNPPLAWNEVSVDLKDYRYLRYRGPNDSYGNVAEIEFYRDGVKLTAAGFGTPGSWNNQGSTLDKALDGDPNTFFDAPIASGAYVGIDAQ